MSLAFRHRRVVAGGEAEEVGRTGEFGGHEVGARQEMREGDDAACGRVGGKRVAGGGVERAEVRSRASVRVEASDAPVNALRPPHQHKVVVPPTPVSRLLRAL